MWRQALHVTTGLLNSSRTKVERGRESEAVGELSDAFPDGMTVKKRTRRGGIYFAARPERRRLFRGEMKKHVHTPIRTVEAGGLAVHVVGQVETLRRYMHAQTLSGDMV